MKMNIPITKTIFGDEEKEAIVKPLETGWVVQGPNVAKFQNMFADFTGSKYAHAASNCTTALHLGLEAMDITKGDKVIVPSFTYVASANAVEYTGAEVVFCDIDLKTFNIDVQKLDELLCVQVMGVRQDSYYASTHAEAIPLAGKRLRCRPASLPSTHAPNCKMANSSVAPRSGAGQRGLSHRAAHGTKGDDTQQLNGPRARVVDGTAPETAPFSSPDADGFQPGSPAACLSRYQWLLPSGSGPAPCGIPWLPNADGGGPLAIDTDAGEQDNSSMTPSCRLEIGRIGA